MKITVTKVGGKQEEMISYVYDLPLTDSMEEIVHFRVYGTDRISTKIKAISIENVLHLFHGITGKSVRRPTGEYDVLVGFEYAGHRPVCEQSVGNLLLLGNRFGKCLGGSHPLLKEGTKNLYSMFLSIISGVSVWKTFITLSQWVLSAHHGAVGVSAVIVHWEGKATT